MARTYSFQPSQTNPFVNTAFIPSEAKPVEQGSTSGGQAVLNAYAFADPGYGPSHLDRYAQDIANTKGYGNELMAYEDGLQLVKDQTNQYYDSVRRMNDLSVKAEQMGFNIKRPDPRDEIQLALYREYQDTHRNAKYTANQLKQGRQQEQEVLKAVLEGKIIPNRYDPAFTGDQATSAQAVYGLKQRTSANVKAYNDEQRNFDNANAYRQGKAHEDQLRAYYQGIVNDPNADPYSKEVAASQLGQMQVTTYDDNQALNRQQQAQMARERQSSGQSTSQTAESAFAVLNGVLQGQNFQIRNGQLLNQTLNGTPLYGKTITHATRGQGGQTLLHLDDRSTVPLDRQTLVQVAKGLVQKNGGNADDIDRYASKHGLVGQLGGEFLEERYNDPQTLANARAFNAAADQVNEFVQRYVADFAQKSIPAGFSPQSPNEEGKRRIRTFTVPVSLYPGAPPTEKLIIEPDEADPQGNPRFKVFNQDGQVLQYVDATGKRRLATRMYEDELMADIAPAVARNLAKTQQAYQELEAVTNRIQQQSSRPADLDFNRTNSSHSSSSAASKPDLTNTLYGKPSKSVSRQQLQALVGKKDYEGYTLNELIDYYRQNGYTINDNPVEGKDHRPRINY